MSNPHNPTGTVPTREVLGAIAGLAAAHGVTVISDEIHGPLVLPGSDHVPFMSVAPDDADAVILVSASKAWNLPGLKCAQLVGTARTAPIIAERLPMDVTYGTGHLGVIAAVAAYREGGPWLDDVVAIIDGNRSCSPSCWPSTCPVRATSRRRRRTSRGSTCVRTTSVMTLPWPCASGGGSR